MTRSVSPVPRADAASRPPVSSEGPPSRRPGEIQIGPTLRLHAPATVGGPHRSPRGPGRRLGRYQLVEPVARGCQAVVWRAVQVEPALGEVALKVLPPDAARDPRRRAQFHKEAEWGALLSHPALLPVYEHGHADGHAYLAMPLVSGPSLAELVRLRREEGAGHRGACGAAADATYAGLVVRAIARVARGLEAAHAAGVAHRDVKPANVVLDGPDSVVAYLCDFGLGRDLGGPAGSRIGEAVGSPQYMPPEKILGLRSDDVLGDIYALGVTLYEALALVPPVEVPEDLPKVCWGPYLATTPATPLRARCPSLPGCLERAILRATDRDPSRRPARAGDFAEELEAVAETLPLAG